MIYPPLSVVRGPPMIAPHGWTSSLLWGLTSPTCPTTWTAMFVRSIAENIKLTSTRYSRYLFTNTLPCTLFKVKLTGTNAILRHIGRQHNLCGKTEEEMVRVDMAAEQVMDMRSVKQTKND